MKDLSKLLYIYELVNFCVKNVATKTKLKKEYVAKLTELYQKRHSQYNLTHEEKYVKDIEIILNWLKKNDDATSKLVYESLLKDFLEEVEKNKKIKEGSPIINEFGTEDKSDTVVISGGKVKLKWDVSNAQEITLHDELGKIAVQGRLGTEIYPLAGDNMTIKRYTLKATNKYGEDLKQLEITVLPIPRLELVNTPFPAIEIITPINIDVGLVIPEISENLTKLIDQVNFYPTLMTSMSDADFFNDHNPSPFNIFLIYGRIRQHFRKRSK